jgi:ferredoxin
MSTNDETLFQKFIARQDESAWHEAINALLPSIHEVDKTATQIWFAFYPLALFRALESAEAPELLARRLLLQGKYLLRDQIDSSHRFLYGHRYWPEVKRAVTQHAASFNEQANPALADQIRKVAREVAASSKVEDSLVTGISAVAFMTIAQVGTEAFVAAPGTVSIDRKHARKSPQQVLEARAQDDSQGLLGFLRTVDKRWTVTYDENEQNANFKLINEEELASASARDKSCDWRAADARCIEGPIPVECRSASCGTCWIGVLGGAEKLTEVAPLEAKQIKEFGYINTDELKPVIRLACQARGTGAVSIVIPSWNGVFGKYLRAKQMSPPEEVASNSSSNASSGNGGVETGK